MVRFVHRLLRRALIQIQRYARLRNDVLDSPRSRSELAGVDSTFVPNLPLGFTGCGKRRIWISEGRGFQPRRTEALNLSY